MFCRRGPSANFEAPVARSLRLEPPEPGTYLPLSRLPGLIFATALAIVALRNHTAACKGG